MKRFGNVGMIAVTVAAALGCYTLSLGVSAERTDVERLQRKVASDLRDVHGLEAELQTRARVTVLQRWNDHVLGLAAPLPKQFAADAYELAAYAPGVAQPVAAKPLPQVQFAVARDDAPVVSAPPLRGLTKASYEVPPAGFATVSAPAASVTAPAVPRPASPSPVKDRAPAKVAKAADPLGGLLAEIDTAAASERTGFRKVSMR